MFNEILQFVTYDAYSLKASSKWKIVNPRYQEKGIGDLRHWTRFISHTLTYI